MKNPSIPFKLFHFYTVCNFFFCTRALLLVSLLLIGISSFSQINGKSKIVLKDKSVMNNVKVWNIYNNKIEYEYKGSLHDLETHRIARIENDSAVFSFDSLGNLNARPYDYLVKTNGDTVYCIISQLGGNYIYYYPKGRENRSYIPESSIVKYQVFKPEPIKKNDPVAIPEIKKDTVTADLAKVEKDTVGKTPIDTVDKTAAEQKKQEEAPAIVKADSISNKGIQAESKNAAVKETAPSGSDDFCYESYIKGEKAARLKNESIWGVGTFCTHSCLCGLPAPAFSLLALDQYSNTPSHIPDDVDAKCYLLGYRNQKVKRRIYNTAVGGLLSSIIYLGITYYFIAYNGGI